jgi:glycine cleavage system protein P-like pyridoxal-binding family
MQASRRAILNANYMAKRLENDFNVLYRSAAGLLSCKGFCML